MGIRLFMAKTIRRGREPLGAGYGVHGSGEITETGGKSYKAMLKEKNWKKRKGQLEKIGKKLMDRAQIIAEREENIERLEKSYSQSNRTHK